MFEGFSEIPWQLVVEGSTDVSIEIGDSTVQKSDAVFSKGTFRVVVDVPAPAEKEPDFAELMESKRRSDTKASMSDSSSKTPRPMPVTLSYNRDNDRDPKSIPCVMIEGALMKTYPPTPRGPAKIKSISGAIDGALAIGYSVHQGSRRKPPLFHVLTAAIHDAGQRVVVLEGHSDVPWQLEISNATDVSIRLADSTIKKPDAIFSEGAFRVEVRVADPDEIGARSDN